MTHPSPQSLVLFVLLSLFFCVVDASSGEAQQVLESGGVQFGGPSVVEIRSGEDLLPVEEVTGRAEASGVAAGFGGFVRVRRNAVATQQVCQTPCRFQLERPMELRVGGQALHLMPSGDAQRYLVDPTNTAGRVLGVVGIATGAAFMGVGGLMLGLHHALDMEQFDEDPYAMRNVGRGFAIAGSALFVIGIVVRVASKGRIERVDGFDF